jgi:hypothetical protein
MSGKLTQPMVEFYLDRFGDRNSFNYRNLIYDGKSCELLDEFFRLMEQIAPANEDGGKYLWIRADRGPIEDFGDAEELIAAGEYKDLEAFTRAWKDWFPDEVGWYELVALEEKARGLRFIRLAHRIVILQNDREKPEDDDPYDVSEFVQWLIDEVRECLDMLRAGTYNDFVSKNLPPQHRTGTIRRRDFWNVWPEAREEFFKDIAPEDVADFIRLASAQVEDHRDFHGRLASMSAGDFYRFCAMGYAANNYYGCDKTPKEQYYLHADGRDEELGEVDLDSPEAFYAWLTDRSHYGGHPWEVCRGGNSTHISLYVQNDEKGYYLNLAGDAWNRTIEVVKFYLALRRAGIPVFLSEAHTLADRLAETEKIGIVPDGVFPDYCSGLFPNEHIIDFMNLPDEDREKFLPFCTWYDEDPVYLQG